MKEKERDMPGVRSQEATGQPGTGNSEGKIYKREERR